MDNLYIINSAMDGLEFDNKDGIYTIVGYAAHFNKPNLNNEVVVETSFDNSIQLMNDGKIMPVLNYEHDNDKQIGKVDQMEKDSKGLLITAHLNGNIPFVKDWLIPNIESGDLKGLSTEGYVTNKDDIINNSDGSYTVKNFMLRAVAITKYPADYNAAFSIANAWKEFNDTHKSKWYLF